MRRAATLLAVAVCVGCSAQPPEFVADALREAERTCVGAGGVLHPAKKPALHAIDVNGDGLPEYTFDLEASVSCEGAWSIFSCGSLGCPKALFEQRGGKWRDIGGIYVSEPETIELGPDARGGYRDLIVTNASHERWHYEWQGRAYERTFVDVRGFRVEFARSDHGLRQLNVSADLLETPESGGRVIERLEIPTEIAVIGTTEGGYFYVSPCNACESGFLREAVLDP